MKKLILLALAAVMMAGCSNDEYAKSKSKEQGNFGIVEYDSCEYVFTATLYKGFLAHKGNCKFCAERRKKELQEIVEQLKDK